MFLKFVLATALAFAAPANILPNSGQSQAVKARDGRQILADAKGMTVYTFSPDKADQSVCYNHCAKEWPPVIVAAGTQVKPPFGLAKRNDGSMQLTHNHRPLYNYDDDKVQGDIFGDGDDNVWYVIEIK